MTATDAIACPDCGHIFTEERVRAYADQLQVPTMVLRGRLRQRGCNVLGVHHLIGGKASPKTFYPPDTRRHGGKRSRKRSQGRRHRLGLPDPTDSTYILSAYRDAAGKPRWWQP